MRDHGAEAERALLLVRQVERQSRLLRALGVRAHGSRVVVVRGVAEHVGHGPAAAPAGQAGSDTADVRAPVAADLVLIGRPSANVLRVRAFYHEARVTLAAHRRHRLASRNRLLAGAGVLARLGGGERLVVPRVLETGRGLCHSWVVEELIEGRGIRGAEWQGGAAQLATGLADVWLAGTPTRRPISTVVRARHIHELEALLRSSDDAAAAGHRELLDRVRALTTTRQNVLVGWSHGDPVQGNWLRLPDGRAALVDWELAARRPLAHDAMKVLVGLTDPLPVVDETAASIAALRRPGDAPWREQIAASLARWVASWRRERSHAEQNGRVAAYRRRLQQRLDLLERLLR